MCIAGLEPPATCFTGNGCKAYTFVFYALLSMNGRFCRLVKVKFLKDTAFILSKSHFDQCTYCGNISVPKMQTDRQITFQLYIVDTLVSVPVLSCRSLNMPVCTYDSYS